LSVPFSNIVMAGLITRAAPPEKAVLARFPPAMSRVGRIGLALLWITGPILLYTKWGGFGAMPWTFDAKITAVVLLTLTVTYIHRLETLIRKGDAAAALRIQTVGKVALAFAVIAVVFAVLTFN
jgi:protoporphyrinogen IX oxidase